MTICGFPLTVCIGLLVCSALAIYKEREEHSFISWAFHVPSDCSVAASAPLFFGFDSGPVFSFLIINFKTFFLSDKFKLATTKL